MCIYTLFYYFSTEKVQQSDCLLVMNWTDYARHFCEGKVGFPLGPIKEPANTFSSIFMVFFGLLGLIQSPRAPLIIQFLYGMLFFNGIGSTFFHTSWQVIFNYKIRFN